MRKRKIEQLQMENEDLTIENSVLRVEKEKLNRDLETASMKLDYYDQKIRHCADEGFVSKSELKKAASSSNVI